LSSLHNQLKREYPVYSGGIHVHMVMRADTGSAIFWKKAILKRQADIGSVIEANMDGKWPAAAK
jgi:hypothetical protein